MFGVPFVTAFWLWVLPVLLLVGQFAYCYFSDREKKHKK